ncbi:MAG TPA: FAD-binding oxidoreductase, partial [Nitrososphaerales archaeon]|nr:FAD-binding oxidoreductase [Nitrososphaerales archaeon]
MRLVSEGPLLEELSQDSGIIRLKPSVACYAESERDVEAALFEAEKRGISVTLRGGGTSIPSQSIGTGMTLLQESNGIDWYQKGTVTAAPGVLKSDLNAFLGSKAAWMPVDPSSYRSCTVGGMVANNSSGIRTPKYGSTIDFVSALRVVVPGGHGEAVGPVQLEGGGTQDKRAELVIRLLLDNQKDILDETPQVTKNSSGYRLEKVIHDGHADLPRLFVGSEGTLGAITQVQFRTLPPPAWRLLVVAEASLETLGGVVDACRNLGPSAVELVDKSIFKRMGRGDRVARYSKSDDDFMVFCELDGAEGNQSEALEGVAASRVGGLDPLVVSAPSEMAEAWEVRNETLTVALEIRRNGKTMLPGVEDLVVPPGRLADLVKLLSDQFGRRGLESISYGHAGDANLHARPLLDSSSPKDRRILDELMAECFEAVWKMGGSMTGEHGDGMLRAPYVARQYP